MARVRKTKTEFGLFLVQAIKEAHMVQEEFYTAVGIKKPYFYDILTGSTPPQDTLEKMIEVFDNKLGPNAERRNTFYDLAAKCRQEIPADINDLIKNHPECWETIRSTLTNMLTVQK